MSSPYLLIAFLYILLALLTALDAAFTSFTLLPWFNGLRWLRVHFITLGVLTQALFGLLPGLVAIRTNQPRPQFRWDIWATLNAGLVILLIGIPMLHVYLIFAGGTLVFIATSFLGMQLYGMRNLSVKQPPTLAWDQIDPHIGRKFYLAGLAYFLLGIIVGTGLWLGWGAALRIQTPIEVHIHANNWGLMSLVFAGLLVDLYPHFAGRPLAWPRSITPIFWMMTLGALGLVLGPWTASLYFTVPGLVLHLSATIWLILNVVKPLWGNRPAWTPGIWHLVLSYFWILAPVLVAPLIILGVPGFPGAGIEQSAPQALIYGWVFQFGYALLPFLFRRVFLPEEAPKLGGNWLSLVAVNLGGGFLWASIFITPITGLLHGSAYALWAVSILPIAGEIWHIVRDGMARLEEAGKPVVQGESSV
jgi:cytochrome c oxidase cbb3-type subunit I